MNDLFKLNVQRDSVSMADDICAPHESNFQINAQMSLRDFIDQINFGKYLPEICTGEATWVLENAVGQVLAVYAQQWSEMVFLVDDSLPISLYFKHQHVHFGYHLFFRYHLQIDPELLLQHLIMTNKSS